MSTESGRRLRWMPGIAIGGAVLGAAIFLATSAATLRLGFPLDDAWIHQTYARNLATSGEWAFVPGEASGGSTSPLWTLLLAVGHRLGLDPRSWAYLLGVAALAFAGYIAGRWLLARGSASDGAALLVVLLVATEWHLLWSAVSGMEVILVLALVPTVLWGVESESWRPEWVGVLIGIGIWIRPDVVTLSLIPALVLVVKPGLGVRDRLASLARLALGVSIPFGAYLLFNLRTAGTIWPSTFYAKQAEYAASTASPFLGRFLRVASQPLIGPGILLLPGAALAALVSASKGRWTGAIALLWSLGYLALYAARLPVTYQHGRYEMPVLPVLLVLGAEGVRVARSGSPSGPRRVVTRAWAASVLLVALGFIGLGARAYGQDVAFIESEMVDTARWVRDNTEPGSLIAAHDIGALGYFGGRDILDLAGLTDAEVIPMVGDEAGLARILWEAGADYLMTFPSWYPELASCGEIRYASHSPFGPALGGDNMAVYGWPPTPALAPGGCMLYSPGSAAKAIAHERDLGPDRR